MFDIKAIGRDFGEAAGRYDAHASLQQQVRSHALALAREYIPAQSHVLDIGCGTGALAREAQDWRVTGIDLSYGMCAAAKGEVINASAGQLPVADAAVDGVFSSLMLQWEHNPLGVYKEMLRVLKPSGVAVVATFVHGTLAELAQAFSAIDDAPHVSRFMDAPTLLMQAAHAGGVVLEMEEYTRTHTYADVRSLMRALKNIGASNKEVARKKGLMTPAQLARVDEAYVKENGTVTASWRVLMMVIGRP